jgi:hypothetical protein
VILADAAFVVAENHVHHPMEAILHRPMIADEWPKSCVTRYVGGETGLCKTVMWDMRDTARRWSKFAET